jgi:hypothetical protein
MTQAMVDPTSGVAIPAYAYADFPDEVSVYQAPIVAQFTDDDGDGDVDDDDTPDIAVVMANEDHDILGGVLRVIAGDGSRIVDSIRYQSFTNANGTHDYAPYHFSGTAAANLDGDDEIELAALVVRQSDSLCYPAIYELTRSGVNRGTLSLEHVYEGSNYNCGAHAPAIADLTSDGTREVIFGKAVFRGSDLSQVWYGAGGRGWYGRDDYPAPDGYWNSGYHSFAVDLDGDGQDLEVVAGRTVYTSTGGTFCELGEYVSGVWTPAIDGYPAVGNVLSFPGDGGGEAEIVVTGNEDVSVYHGDTRYDPNGQARCTLITRLPNDPLLDPAISGSLPTHPSCDPAARSFGGPSTIADFDGDGDREVAVAGACYYSVYRFTSGGALQRYAVYETKDWSSSSTGSTVFDFNDDGKSEIVFSDEEAVYVWSLDPTPGLDPWERLVPVMVDDQHKSWTIHEYPLVADVDGDGKAEIVVSNSYLPRRARSLRDLRARRGRRRLGLVAQPVEPARVLDHQRRGRRRRGLLPHELVAVDPRGLQHLPDPGAGLVRGPRGRRPRGRDRRLPDRLRRRPHRVGAGREPGLVHLGVADHAGRAVRRAPQRRPGAAGRRHRRGAGRSGRPHGAADVRVAGGRRLRLRAPRGGGRRPAAVGHARRPQPGVRRDQQRGDAGAGAVLFLRARAPGAGGLGTRAAER